MNVLHMTNQSGIYQITNMVTGSVYIGSAMRLRNRAQLHLKHLKSQTHQNKHLQRAWDKYGSDSFVINAVEIVSDVSRLLIEEQKWIHIVKPEYNICKVAGSQLGLKRSRETREKISRALKGRVLTPEWIAKMSATKRAQHLKCVPNDETRSKISAAMVGNQNGVGHVVTDEHRAIILRANIGRKFSTEHRQKLSLRRKQWWERKRALVTS